jgi:hypothetical protein
MSARCVDWRQIREGIAGVIPPEATRGRTSNLSRSRDDNKPGDLKTRILTLADAIAIAEKHAKASPSPSSKTDKGVMDVKRDLSGNIAGDKGDPGKKKGEGDKLGQKKKKVG